MGLHETELQSALPDISILTGEDVAARSAQWGAHVPLQAKAVLRPKSAAEVARILRLCADEGQSVVTHGGMTGLVRGGAAEPGDVVLSLELMNKIEEIDPLNRIAVVQAGVPLETLQSAAEGAGLLFPVDTGARGSASIGGMIATNAGGNQVIRYGMMREQVLGLEAVLADGTVVSSMNRVLKNNAGYDLKQLFIGSEGTLGVVTRAVLRLRERPRSMVAGFVAVPDYDSVLRLLKMMDGGLGGTLAAFEVMWNSFYRLVTTPPAPGKPPLGQDHAYYVLIEAMGGDQSADEARFEALLGEALEAGLVADALLAKSEAERKAFWALRDDVAQVIQLYPVFVFDVSVPLTQMQGYIAEMEARLGEAYPDHRHVIFGHLGDCNIHLAVGVPEDGEDARAKVERAVYEPLAGRAGTISAEHGIGLEKKAYLGLSRSREEIALMRTLKSALDPKGLLNPGKILG